MIIFDWHIFVLSPNTWVFTILSSFLIWLARNIWLKISLKGNFSLLFFFSLRKAFFDTCTRIAKVMPQIHFKFSLWLVLKTLITNVPKIPVIKPHLWSFTYLYLNLGLLLSVLQSLVWVNNRSALCLPCSSQYGWRGSGMSMGDGVLDSGKASDLSVCSWPVEPIHWTPFPILQHLASHGTPKVSV